MFHTLAWFESITSVTFVNINPILDNILAIQNSRFSPQQDFQLLYAQALGVNLDRAQLNSPTFRQFSPKGIMPVGVAALPASLSTVADYRRAGLTIRGLEELSLEVQNVAAGANEVHGVIGIQDVFTSAPVGDVYTLHGSSVSAITANAWSQLTMTFDDTLPAGSYFCIGMQYLSAAGIAARIIFENQVLRPGCIAITSMGDVTDDMFRAGNLGRWGQFTANRFPNFEVLNNAASVIHDIWLDFIKVG